MWTPGPGELIVIILVLLLFFGAKRLPELAQGLGKGIREFKKATRGELDEDKKLNELDQPKKKEESEQ